MSEPTRRFARPTRFLRARLSPEGYLGLHLTIGLFIVLVAGWWFGDIAEDMSRNAATRVLDERIASWFHQHATHPLTVLAFLITFFGSVGFIAASSSFTAVVLAWRRLWNALLTLTLAMGGGSLLNILLKHLFYRQRPILENPLTTLASYGFPSGHAMGATIFYGFLALLFAQRIQTWRLRVLVFCLAAMWVALIGLSRIYLGAHYLTDVLGAIAAGCVWLSISWTGVETMRRWRKTRRPL